MAEHADGSIIVDTEIDPQGFKAGSSELQRAIKSLNKKMEALGPTFQKALSGNASALASFDSKAAALQAVPNYDHIPYRTLIVHSQSL